jgi:hypothetical protein
VSGDAGAGEQGDDCVDRLVRAGQGDPAVLSSTEASAGSAANEFCRAFLISWLRRYFTKWSGRGDFLTWSHVSLVGATSPI